MSRIHEALQQAERDRLANLASSAAPAAVPQTAPELPSEAGGAWVAVSTPTPSIKSVASAPAVLSSAAAEEIENRAPSPFLERCAKPTWSPDPQSMLFFTTEGAHGSEQFRTLRSHLYEMREKQPLKKLLITSALPGEGKSFIAANLAQVIACQHGRRVLLIDADLRKSGLHAVLGAPANPGLVDYLDGSAEETAIIQRAPLEGLFFIPGGSISRNPAELISGSRMPALLDSLAEYFDWIVIDCPPCIPVADARIIAPHCDGVLMVVASDGTPQDVARKAKQQFKDGSLIGVVLNRAAINIRYGSYYYGAYGAYGARQGSPATRV